MASLKHVLRLLIDLVCNIFQGTKSVLGIFLNLREIKDALSISGEAFSGMKNLRFLRIYGISEEDKETILQLRVGKTANLNF